MLGRLGAVLLLVGAPLTVVVVAIALGGGPVGLAQRTSPPPEVGEVVHLPPRPGLARHN